MADDLYKAASVATMIDDALQAYLMASAATLCRIVGERGFVIHYVVDNTYDEELSMQRPLQLYQPWFEAAGFAYICPQKVAELLMGASDPGSASVYEHLPLYIREGRHLADEIVTRCHAENIHYVFLDTDSCDNSFEVASSRRDEDDVIWAFRNEAPIPGSHCVVNRDLVDPTTDSDL